MKIQWTVTPTGNRTKFSAHSGLIRATYWADEDGKNYPYEIYVRSGGRRKIILRVENNHGASQVNAKARCEFLLACLDNNLAFEFLDIEEVRHPGTVYQPDNIPVPPKFYDVDGLLVGRVYRHHAGDFYRVILITNRGVEKPGWVKTVCYRNILTGVEFSRPFVEFTKERYTLVPLQSVIPAKHNFRTANVVKETTEV